jgi:hypothetical protein
VIIIGIEEFFRIFDDSVGHYIVGLPPSIMFALGISLIYFYMRQSSNLRCCNEDFRDHLI